MEGSKPVITEAQQELIKRHAALLGEDGDAIIQDIQAAAEQAGRLPADIFMLIESCCQDLNKRVASLEISNELIRERETERLAQVEAMREQVSRYNGARASGDKAALARIKPMLCGLMDKYVADVDKDQEDGLALDVAQTWKDQAHLIVDEALIFFSNFFEDDPAPGPEDSLAPLRKATETATHLAGAVAKEIQDPSEERLRDLARKLGTVNKEIMALSRSLMVGQAASVATEANRLACDAGETIKSSRNTIKAALRGLGAASDISEVSSPNRTSRPPPSRPVLGDLSAEWATGGQPAAPEWAPFHTPATTAWPTPESAPRPRMGGASKELTTLMQGLMGAQANDSGWPTFSEKYVEYPRFRKEWWAYRQTYHGHVRDELVCRSLKEKSLASNVRLLVNDIDDLREAWNTLDTSFDRPERYISGRASKSADQRSDSTRHPSQNALLRQAFWNFVDQKWRDALNMAAAEPPAWGTGRAAPQEGGKRGGAAEATKLAKASMHVTEVDGKRPCQGEGGRQCMFKDVMGCPGTHPPWHCKTFGKLQAKEREKVIKDNRLCPFCLLHDKDKPCGAKQKPVGCTASNCKGRHIQKLQTSSRTCFGRRAEST
jgi:hypothetical protein